MAETTDHLSPPGGGADKGVIGQWQRSVALARKGLAPFLFRYTTHLVIVLLVTVALSLAGTELPSSADYFNIPTPAPDPGEHDFDPMAARGGARPGLPSGNLLLSTPMLRTTFVEPPASATTLPAEEDVPAIVLASPPLPEANPEANLEKAAGQEIVTYTVRANDTISSIATHFGLSPKTLMWSNPSIELTPDLLKLGQELTILPVDGVYHTVVAVDTLESIGTRYKVTAEDVVNYELNHIPDDGQLYVGQKLVIPGGKKPDAPRVVEHYTGPIPEDAKRGTGIFGWPASGRISQGFREGHRAIDIAKGSGTPIYASDSGYVAKAGWSDIGYGQMILIDHNNGFQTLYAHLHVILVQERDSVAKGMLIGRIGATGNSTGPHLHFEIRSNGVKQNPLTYLSSS